MGRCLGVVNAIPTLRYCVSFEALRKEKRKTRTHGVDFPLVFLLLEMYHRKAFTSFTAAKKTAL